MFNTIFRDGFLGTGETAIKADFAANTIYHWAPQTPTHLFHGKDDTIVPYFNATNALAAMSTAGSTQVTLVDCNLPTPLADHAECVPDFLNELIGWFGLLANDL